jgi:hypothetical protein
LDRHYLVGHAAKVRTLRPTIRRSGDAEADLGGRFRRGTDPGAHHYRFIGIEVAPKGGAFVSTLLQFGDKEASADAVPHHLIVDRCYVHGDAKVGARRGVALNGRHIAVIDSYVADFKEVGADSQGRVELEWSWTTQDRQQLSGSCR